MSPYNNEINIIFEAGQLDRLKATTFALETLSATPEFVDMMRVATLERDLNIVLARATLFGNQYRPKDNTIILDFERLSRVLYQNSDGIFTRASIQEVIFHELQHAVQTQTSTLAYLGDTGIMSSTISAWVLEPDAIAVTNEFREKYLGIPPRVGHVSDIAPADQSGNILIYGELSPNAASNQDLLTLSIDEIGDEYLDGRLEGYVLTTDEWAGIYYGDSFNDLTEQEKEYLQAEFGRAASEALGVLNRRDYCFAPETPIDMADGSTRPIAEISPGDWVVSFDQTAHGGRGGLVPRRVTAVHVNKARHLLNFHGTRVTPGHVFLRAEGGFAPLLDILRADGAVVDAKGQTIRACTGFPVGSAEDAEIEILFYPHGADGPTIPGKLRGGTRLRMREGSDETETLLEMLARHGCELLSDGTVRKPGREAGPLPWPGAPVEPYAHLLRVSGYRSLEQLYDDPASWEGRDPRLPASALM